MTEPIVVETTKQTEGYPKGSELGFASVAKAESVLGEGAFKVVRNQDGSEYQAPKQAPAKTASKDEKA